MEEIKFSNNQNLEVSNIILNHLLDSEQYVQICQNTQYMKKNSLFENKIVYQPVIQPFSQCRTYATKFHQIDQQPSHQRRFPMLREYEKAKV